MGGKLKKPPRIGPQRPVKVIKKGNRTTHRYVKKKKKEKDKK